MVLVSNRTSFQEIIDKDGFFNIKTDSVQPLDAGVYTCNIRSKEGEELRIEKRSAHLIVLDSVPNCTSVNYSTNGRKFKRLSCSVSFRGDWAPVMEWRQGGFHGSIVTTGVQSHTLANFVSQNISIPVDVDGENAISYTCIIFFMGNFSASATNIPNFTFIWPANSQLLSSPLNTAVLSGEPTEMSCSVNPDSYTIVFCSWEFIRSGSIEESTIYTPALGINKSVTSFELRHQSKSSCDLIAKEVQLRDAGLYICNIRLKNAINGSTTIEQNSAQLVVLESKPYCGKDVEAVNRRCSVFYQGNWPPVIKWRRNNGQTIHGVMNQGAHGNISNTLDDKENAAYTCVVHFSTYFGNISMSARNTPSNSFTCPSRHTESVSAPANTAVIKGNNVRLLCKTQKGWPVHSWTFMAAGSTIAERIYDGIEPAAKQHTFELGHKSFDLSIRPTHLKDAGVYACNKKSIIGGEEKNVQSSAHLIVLEANPHCGVEAVTGNSTEETFRLWCSVRYRGSWTPVMEWRQDAEDGLLMHDVQNITVPNNEVTYILTIVARFAKKNTVYFCRTYFSETLGSFAFVSATNVPEYSHLWTSPPINHSSEIPLLTMIVTLVGIFLLMFMALTVYHVFFKRMIAGRLKKQNVASNMQPDEGNQQPGSYATIQDDTTRIEPETLEPEYEESILEAAPNQPPGVYNEMGPNAITRPHCYSRLSSTPPLLLSVTGHIEDADADSTMINDNETHHYANFTSK